MNLALWAAMTGLVTALVWRGIILFGRERRPRHLMDEHEALEARLQEIEAREQRVLELEERLEFVERLLAQEREQKELSRPKE